MGSSEKLAEVISIKVLRDAAMYSGGAADLLTALMEHLECLHNAPEECGPITMELLEEIAQCLGLVRGEFGRKGAPNWTMYGEIRSYMGLVAEFIEQGETDLEPGSYFWCAVMLLFKEMQDLIQAIVNFEEHA